MDSTSGPLRIEAQCYLGDQNNDPRPTNSDNIQNAWNNITYGVFNPVQIPSRTGVNQDQYTCEFGFSQEIRDIKEETFYQYRYFTPELNYWPDNYTAYQKQKPLTIYEGRDPSGRIRTRIEPGGVTGSGSYSSVQARLADQPMHHTTTNLFQNYPVPSGRGSPISDRCPVSPNIPCS
ncbi:hypothetical protein HLRTI_001545 [Halorhabdus tiamatea SARL4B]|uniref:Uncharacterized protein n=1 Tax=Halorhabdus tiamatea SARL4B TaxID=1033806 RepID=U2F881_9EURY|nr:hypothetical protein [Halorhabdus tiamatea]ERJ06340.1 hypothetical protein HLRTI_001545 [Halorhabdus tiamatea SARL4B]